MHSVLLHRSTNIHALATDPLDVLFSSLLWIDGKNLEPYLLLFTLFLAPAEHWLGHLRWLTVGLTSHILATYISEGMPLLRDRESRRVGTAVRARDIGVSYFLVGVMAVLAYHIARPWRWGYLGVLFVIFGFPLLTMDSHRAELHRDRSLRRAADRSGLLPDGPGAKARTIEPGAAQSCFPAAPFRDRGAT